MTDYNKNKPETIQHMFGTIAKRYDRANSVLSMQMHKLWNAELVKQILQHQESVKCQDNSQDVLLDLCCGTGDIAFGLLKRSKKPQQAILVDFCPEMLECAKDKTRLLKLNDHKLEFIQADVQKLPLKENSVNSATIAYGIRNVKDPILCFIEAYRVLKPGGIFGILELTKPSNGIIRFGHSIYLRTMLPLLGKLVTSNQEAYKYLCNSIHTFIPPDHLEHLLKQAGFVNTRQIPLALGTATILLGQKE